MKGIRNQHDTWWQLRPPGWGIMRAVIALALQACMAAWAKRCALLPYLPHLHAVTPLLSPMQAYPAWTWLEQHKPNTSEAV